jgi:TrmH family RNA methyltransferase
MITSPDNSKLKLVRKLRERKGREREGLFATEGEDLRAAGRACGAAPRFVLIAAGSGLEAGPGGEEVEPELLAGISGLGSGTRAIAVWERPALAVGDPAAAADPASEPPAGGTSVSPAGTGSGGDPVAAPCVYLHGVSDPGNVGAIVRTADALIGGTVALGPGCADAYGPKAIRASMGSIFARPPLRVAAIGETPAPRVALVAHGGEVGLDALDGAATVCLGAEREGLPAAAVAACDATATIPLRPGGAESLNVAAAAAIACARMKDGTDA